MASREGGGICASMTSRRSRISLPRSWSPSVPDPLGYYLNNTAHNRKLIECAVEARRRHFIFSSTAAVYGKPAAMPVTENDADAADVALWPLRS